MYLFANGIVYVYTLYLSLSYREPERHAIWCITCLLIAGSFNPILNAVYPIIVHKMYSDEDWLDKMLCTTSYIFYNQTVSHHCMLVRIANDKRRN